MVRKKLRGSGVRYTLPFIGRFVGMWVLVTVAAVAVAAVSSYPSSPSARRAPAAPSPGRWWCRRCSSFSP